MSDPAYPGYPPGCPPAVAEPADGVVYRATNHDPPDDEDFLSWEEMGRSPRHSTPKALCQSRGLSVFRSLADARHYLSVFPGVNRFISVGVLTPDHGRIKPTPSRDRPTHTTWWCGAGVDRKIGFSVLPEPSHDVDG